MPERREKVRTKEWKNKWIMHEGRKGRKKERHKLNKTEKDLSKWTKINKM